MTSFSTFLIDGSIFTARPLYDFLALDAIGFRGIENDGIFAAHESHIEVVFVSIFDEQLSHPTLSLGGPGNLHPGG